MAARIPTASARLLKKVMMVYLMLQASLACVKDKLRKVDAALVVLQLSLYVIVIAHRLQFIRLVLIKGVYTGPNIAPGFFAH